MTGVYRIWTYQAKILWHLLIKNNNENIRTSCFEREPEQRHGRMIRQTRVKRMHDEGILKPESESEKFRTLMKKIH